MFNRFVQSGRVAYIANGPNRGKLCSIVDVIDQTRVLVDGPETGVDRGMIRINQLQLTKFKTKFPFTAPTRLVRKAWRDANVNDLWENTKWAKKLDSVAKRRAMNDFDRFKLRKAKRARNVLRYKCFRKLLTKAKKTKCTADKKKWARVYEIKKAKQAKKDGPKKDGVKKATAKKAEGKKDAPKKDAPKKEAPKKAAPAKK